MAYARRRTTRSRYTRKTTRRTYSRRAPVRRSARRRVARRPSSARRSPQTVRIVIQNEQANPVARPATLLEAVGATTPAAPKKARMAAK